MPFCFIRIIVFETDGCGQEVEGSGLGLAFNDFPVETHLIMDDFFIFFFFFIVIQRLSTKILRKKLFPFA